MRSVLFQNFSCDCKYLLSAKIVSASRYAPLRRFGNDSPATVITDLGSFTAL